MNDWLKLNYDKINERIGVLGFVANDFQNQKLVFITTNGRGHHETYITPANLIAMSIYFTVRHCLNHNWLNHNDQFLFPMDAWENDSVFHNDCLAFSLFYEKNQIKSNDGRNHWIPFTEQEVNAQNRFESHFMTHFMNGKIKIESESNIFGTPTNQNLKREFSEEAQAVFNAGRELWKYYHSKPKVNANASLYDIREYFQGRNGRGRMNNKSDDEKYMELIGELRNKLNFLADKIKPKIYEYKFLIE